MDTAKLTKDELRHLEIAKAHLLAGCTGAAARVLSAAVRYSTRNSERLAAIGAELGLTASPDWIS